MNKIQDEFVLINSLELWQDAFEQSGGIEIIEDGFCR